ncbi:MAG: cysteine desulfurase [Spirochaetales bacterium]|nr:cysteine desulfurase [Spirochaetales bacterium]
MVSRAEHSEIRRMFPFIRNHPDYAYLDNAATALKPDSVIQALSSYYVEYPANIHRGVHRFAGRATLAYENVREKVRRFIGAASADEVVFTSGTTAGLNMLADLLGRDLKEGDEVLLTEMEHHSNLVPWQLAARKYGFALHFVPFLPDGTLDMAFYAGALERKPAVVAFTALSNVFGTINEIHKMCAEAKKTGALTVLDAAQAVPHLQPDVAEIGCDFLCFSGHKLYGPTGTGVLYGRRELLDALPPFFGGGEMVKAVQLDKAVWNELPWKFEAGTQNIAGVIGLGAALDFIRQIGPETIEMLEKELTAYAAVRLAEIPGVRVYGPVGTDRHTAVFLFTVDGVHPHDAAQYLDGQNAAVRSGHHCAHPVMRKLGVPATTRASLAFYNSNADIDRLAGGLRGLGEHFRNAV